MKIVLKSFLTILLMMTGFAAFAQDKVEMADLMRSNGRIYVVVAVMLIILLGLILYVARVDRKINKLEKENRP